MPTTRKRYSVLSKDEAEDALIKAQAKSQKLSVANWFRVKAELPALEIGVNFKINNPAKKPKKGK